MKEKKEKKKKDRFNKMKRLVKNMILMASAVDSDKAEEEPIGSCLRFINSEMAALLNQELNFMLEDMGHEDIGYTYGMAHNTLQSQNMKKKYLVLHLVPTQGRRKTVEECKISTKQQTKAPISQEDLGKQPECFKVMIKIFFKRDSKFHRLIKELC
eukprot:11032699-Ditylum_brightwellii.AAC.1